MHFERIYIERRFIETLLLSIDKTIIPVGTTSCRTLESLYWFGVKLHLGEKHEELHIAQWDAYQEKYNKNISLETALQSILDFMISNNL